MAAGAEIMGMRYRGGNVHPGSMLVFLISASRKAYFGAFAVHSEKHKIYFSKKITYPGRAISELWAWG